MYRKCSVCFKLTHVVFVADNPDNFDDGGPVIECYACVGVETASASMGNAETMVLQAQKRLVDATEAFNEVSHNFRQQESTMKTGSSTNN